MGREIRRVPVGWEHPKKDNGNFRPMFDAVYEDAIEEWYQNHRLWLKGEHPDQSKYDTARERRYYAEWDGNPPDVEFYHEPWGDEATGWVMYETVSEGTPLTPVFATREELVDFLCTNQDFCGEGPISREAAERFTGSGWAPSLIFTPETGLQKGYTFIPQENA